MSANPLSADTSSSDEKDKIRQQFENYNQSSYDIKMLNELFESDFFNTLDASTRNVLLENYAKKLNFNMSIDEIWGEGTTDKNTVPFQKRFAEWVTDSSFQRIKGLCDKVHEKLDAAIRSSELELKLKFVEEAAELTLQAAQCSAGSTSSGKEHVEQAFKKVDKVGLHLLDTIPRSNKPTQQLVHTYIMEVKNTLSNARKALNFDASIASLSAKIVNESPNLASLKDSEKFKCSQFVQGMISYLNSHRLDGVWCRNLVNTLLDQGLMVSDNLKELSQSVAIINGYASYGMYAARGGIEIAKLLAQTFSDDKFFDKHNISNWDRAQVQFGQRYSTIMNDLLWGTTNLVTFYWWTGYEGDILTSAILFIDVFLTLVTMAVEKSKFDALKNELEKIIGDEEVRNKIIQQLETQRNKIHAEHFITVLFQFLLACSFSIMTWVATMIKTSGNLVLAADLVLAGSIACLALQILFNFKDLYIKLTTITNEADRDREIKKSLSRLVVQVAIPALFICYSLCLSPALPVTLPAFFVIAALTTVSSLLVKCVDRYNEYQDAEYALVNSDLKEGPERNQLEAHRDKAWQDLLYQGGYTLSGILLIISIGSVVAAAPFMLMPLCIVLLCVAVEVKLVEHMQNKKSDHDPHDYDLIPHPAK